MKTNILEHIISTGIDLGANWAYDLNDLIHTGGYSEEYKEIFRNNSKEISSIICEYCLENEIPSLDEEEFIASLPEVEDFEDGDFY